MKIQPLQHCQPQICCNGSVVSDGSRAAAIALVEAGIQVARRRQSSLEASHIAMGTPLRQREILTKLFSHSTSNLTGATCTLTHAHTRTLFFNYPSFHFVNNFPNIHNHDECSPPHVLNILKSVSPVVRRTDFVLKLLDVGPMLIGSHTSHPSSVWCALASSLEHLCSRDTSGWENSVCELVERRRHAWLGDSIAIIDVAVDARVVDVFFSFSCSTVDLIGADWLALTG